MRLRSIAVLVSCLALLGAPASAQAVLPLESFDLTFDNEDGSAAALAGSHPFSVSASLRIKPLPGELEVEEELKDLNVAQVAGLVGDPTATSRCATEDFLDRPGGVFPNFIETSCPDSAALGVVTAQIGTGVYSGAVYNLAPAPGSVAKIGFVVDTVPVTLEFRLSQKPPYNVIAVLSNASNQLTLIGSKLVLWGDPSNPVHDPLRGNCASVAATEGKVTSRGNCPTLRTSLPFLTLPRACRGPLTTSYAADSWEDQGARLPDGEPNLSDPAWVRGAVPTHDTAGNPLGFGGCPELGFGPTIESQPSTHAAESPTGLEFDLNIDDPGLTDSMGRADSDIEKAVVTLPQGVTTNPSVASGLSACTLAQYESETVGSDPGTGCPESSKVGAVEVETPLLEKEPEEGAGLRILRGSIYVAKQHDNPFDNLLTIYMVIKDPKLGILIKLPGKVEPNPSTGQLTTTFDQLPQLPFSHFHLHFRDGARAPLITPATCGKYNTEAVFYPYAAGIAPVHQSATFEINSGANGSQCQSPPPYGPGFNAGTRSPLAGAYSPFILNLTRADGTQQFSSITTTLPQGLLAKLASIPYCSEDGIAQASSRSAEGQGALELASPSCPSASEVGSVTVGSGAGPTPLYVSGRAYLAGPYKGAPLSLVIITPAIAGPFDLGVVAVRTALQVDPFIAQVTAVSDPIPTILHGLPLDVRSISVDMSHPNFTLNPTSCEPKAITGAATTTLGTVTPLSQYFQVAKCNRLRYRPRLKLSLAGATRRAGHPGLRAVLTAPQKGSYANTARIQVGLPHSLFLDQGNLNKVCTQPQLRSATCPKKSIYGHVKVWTPLFENPLKGDVYIGVGFGHKLPDLVTELNGQVRVLLHGRVDTTKGHGLRNTFEFVPDAPYSRVVLRLKGGRKYSLIENSENLCARPQKANARFVAQDGEVAQLRPTIGLDCRAHGARKKKTRKGHGRR